ncbi:MAG: GNAT family N-acetyltransferase [Beijerinckiaceae bacterium]
MRDYTLHYFLRPDHRDVGDLWMASGRHGAAHVQADAGRRWLFLHLENLHRDGAQTTCAIDSRTGGLAGFVTLVPDTGWLDQIIVARTVRGSGVATLLLDEAKRLSPGSIEVDVAEDNSRAIRFCEREGFRKTGLAARAPGGGRMWKLRWIAGEGETPPEQGDWCA